MNELRPFTEHDWRGWSGAEQHEDDNGDVFPPLIGYVFIHGWRHIVDDYNYDGLDDDCEWPMIVDNMGITIAFLDDEVVLPAAYPQAAFIARALLREPRIDPELLALIGFDMT